MSDLDELEQSFVNALQLGRRGHWLLGDLCNEAITNHGRIMTGILASLGRCSKRYIQQLAKVSRTFGEGIREQYPEMPWSLFRVAAGTENPLEWLERASKNEWSEAQLRTAVRGVKPETPRVQKILKAVERVFADSREEADSLEDGLRELLRKRE